MANLGTARVSKGFLPLRAAASCEFWGLNQATASSLFAFETTEGPVKKGARAGRISAEAGSGIVFLPFGHGEWSLTVIVRGAA
jgi:hypothetical protein